MNKLVVKIAAIVVAVLFGVLIWPTLYSYDHMTIGSSTLPVRINRFTGNTEILYRTGWRNMRNGSSSTEDDSLPEADISKLKVNARVTSYGYLECDVYNGSEWTLKEITGQFSILNADGSVAESRKYRLTLDGSGNPYQSSRFMTKLDLNVGQRPNWNFVITEAKGSKGK